MVSASICFRCSSGFPLFIFPSLFQRGLDTWSPTPPLLISFFRDKRRDPAHHSEGYNALLKTQPSRAQYWADEAGFKSGVVIPESQPFLKSNRFYGVNAPLRSIAFQQVTKNSYSHEPTKEPTVFEATLFPRKQSRIPNLHTVGVRGSTPLARTTLTTGKTLKTKAEINIGEKSTNLLTAHSIPTEPRFGSQKSQQEPTV
jgi:hypothetical protein